MSTKGTAENDDYDYELHDLVPEQTAAFAERLDRQWSHEDALSRSMEKLFDKLSQSNAPKDDPEEQGATADDTASMNGLIDLEETSSSKFPIWQQDAWLPEPPYIPPPPLKVDFLAGTSGTATLTYNTNDGKIAFVNNLNINIIAARSPMIAAAFDNPDFKEPRLHLDVLSELTVNPFLRYLYTGSYLESAPYDDIPTSLLLHCQLYFIATVFEMPDLQCQALICVIRQCEFACSSPDQPIDLCPALRFCYAHSNDTQRVADQIVEYCVERFVDHKLSNDFDFISLNNEVRPFYTDLARACRARGFENDTAAEIIRLPYKLWDWSSLGDNAESGNPDKKVDSSSHKKRKSEDLQEERSKITKLPLRPANPPSTSQLTLAIRSAAAPVKSDDAKQSSPTISDDEGFEIVEAPSPAAAGPSMPKAAVNTSIGSQSEASSSVQPCRPPDAFVQPPATSITARQSSDLSDPADEAQSAATPSQNSSRSISPTFSDYVEVAMPTPNAAERPTHNKAQDSDSDWENWT